MPKLSFSTASLYCLLAIAAALSLWVAYRQGVIDERRRIVNLLDGFRMQPWDTFKEKE